MVTAVRTSVEVLTVKWATTSAMCMLGKLKEALTTSGKGPK